VSETAENPETPKVVAPTAEQILAIKAAIINSHLSVGCLERHRFLENAIFSLP
jgi:hypothetical protein